MSTSKENSFRRAKQALERAQKNYDKARAEWQEEVDSIVLNPVHQRTMSRKEANQLARAISDEAVFRKILEMGLLTEGKGEESA